MSISPVQESSGILSAMSFGEPQVNARHEALDQLRRDGTLDDGQLDKVRRAIDLGEARRLQIVQVRPPKELPGNPFSGFFSRDLREEYLDAGRKAATATVERSALAEV